MAEDVFERDDGVVDDHADGEAHSGQADDIDIAAQKRHREEGADDGDRDGGGNDRDGADAAQEDEEHQDGERAADEDIGADQADGALDIVGLVVDLFKVQILTGQRAGVELVDGAADTRHDLEHVSAGFSLGIDGNGGAALLAHRCSGADVAEFSAGDFADLDAGAVATADHDLLDVCGLPVLADGADDIAALALVEGAGADIGVFAGQGLGHVLHGQLARGHGVGVDDDLQLAVIAAVNIGFGHAGYSL